MGLESAFLTSPQGMLIMLVWDHALRAPEASRASEAQRAVTALPSFRAFQL